MYSLINWHFLMHIIHFMKVSFFVGITHEPFQATAQSTSFPGPSPRSNKMADHKAGETRRLLRQCASSLLSACHRLEGGETESATTSLQTFANVTNPPTEPNRPVASSSHTAIQEHKNREISPVWLQAICRAKVVYKVR